MIAKVNYQPEWDTDAIAVALGRDVLDGAMRMDHGVLVVDNCTDAELSTAILNADHKGCRAARVGRRKRKQILEQVLGRLVDEELARGE